jgi:hypothetical protein
MSRPWVNGYVDCPNTDECKPESIDNYGTCNNNKAGAILATFGFVLGILFIFLFLYWCGVVKPPEPRENQVQSEKQENIHYIPAYTGGQKMKK